MSPKRKVESLLKMDGGAEETEHGSDKETLQREFDKLTDTLKKLKRRREELCRENEFLQKEVNQTRLESQAYISYLSRRTQKCQSLIVTLSDQNQQKLEALRKQRGETLAKHQEQSTELKTLILEKEGKLAALNIEILQLGEFKSQQQQQLGRRVELKKEVARMQRQHSESLQALKASFLSEKEWHQGQAKRRAQAEELAASREASRYLQSYTRQVSEENRRLRANLQQLLQRTNALRTRQSKLQAQRQQLLLEREYVTTLKRPHNPSLSRTHPEGQTHSKTQPESQSHPETQPDGQKHPKLTLAGQIYTKILPDGHPNPKTQLLESQAYPKAQSEGLEHPKIQSERQTCSTMPMRGQHTKMPGIFQPNRKTPKTQAEEHPKIKARGKQVPKIHPAGQARPYSKPREQLHSKTQPGGKPQSQTKPQEGSTEQQEQP